MACMRLLAGLALLLASQQLAVQAAPQLCTLAASVLQQCAYPMDPQQTQANCCSPFSVMLDLNCFWWLPHVLSVLHDAFYTCRQQKLIRP